jgi:hypothetical protein
MAIEFRFQGLLCLAAIRVETKNGILGEGCRSNKEK